MREMRQMIFSPYLAEVPMPISVGTYDEIMESRRYGEEFKEKYEDGILLKIGTRHVIAHGEIYKDIINHPLVIRLSWIKQLGMHGFISSISGMDGVVDISAIQTRYAHSIDVGARMEIASRLNGLDEDAVKLDISSGLLHDAYTPPMSEQGKRANTEALDEEKNIDLILNNKGLIKVLEKHGVKPRDVISVVRGEYPVLGVCLIPKGWT